MDRIGLSFRTQQVVSPQFGNWPVTVIRLMTKVQFRMRMLTYFGI